VIGVSDVLAFGLPGTVALRLHHRPRADRERALGAIRADVRARANRIFKNSMTTAPAIDRLVRYSVIHEFDVPSFRTEDAKARGSKSKKGAAETPLPEAGA
jgi:hypothetical protein